MSRASEPTTTHRPDGVCWEDVSPQLLCKFGCNCRAKLNCLWVHKPQVQQWFVDEQLLLQRKMMECFFYAHTGSADMASAVCAPIGRGRRGSQDLTQTMVLVVVAVAAPVKEETSGGAGWE